MAEGDRWRSGRADGLGIIGDDLATIIDENEFDPAVRHLLASITASVVAQSLGTRRLIWLQTGLLALIAWRVW